MVASHRVERARAGVGFGLLLALLLLGLLAFPLADRLWTPSFSSSSRIVELPANSFEFGILGVPSCRSKIGAAVDWSRGDLVQGLKEFVSIYERRPIPNNLYGMGFDHSFGLWFMAHWLQPQLMIESGAFKGHSTWVLRQAMPNCPIISISPRHPQRYLQKGPAYVDKNCEYFADKKFLDFGSIQWDKVMDGYGIKDRSKVLVFFDDHQSELRRVKQAIKAGFKHLIFEDNYDTGTGDHFCLRQICDQFHIEGGGHSCSEDSYEARVRSARKGFWEKALDIKELCGSNIMWWGVQGEMRDNFSHNNTAISYATHVENVQFLESVLDIYWELPPVAGPTLTHQRRFDPARTSHPIVANSDNHLFMQLGLDRLNKSVFNGYTQMAYLRLGY
ncbi:hypothetical protein O6H91_01G038500 [Diphasiastrum complanatum]|uniref:Uncharacterized protein n=1 Tax=Diphasiastrum complanatum TaxID=34168 RepID=A0ACC2EQ76_DIPCM|nr:hypothetical protein O6H91_01G038500 [Diphasiastrum complanatum]